MDAFFAVAKNVLVFILLAVPGFILVKTKKADKQTGTVLSQVLVSVGLPFLIITSVSKIQFNAQTLLLLGSAAIVGFVFHFFMIWISQFLVGSRQDPAWNVSRLSVVFANSGFMGLPLALAIFGSDSPVLTCVIVINIIMNILMQSMSASQLTGQKSRVTLKQIFSPLVISFVIGVALNLLGVFRAIPEAATYCNHLSNMVTPLSMLVVGIQLGCADIKKLFLTGKMYFISFIKLIVQPALICGILLVLGLFTDIPDALVVGSFIAFGMPTAGLVPVYAGIYGGDAERAAIYTMGSTILSTVSIPLLYLLLTFLL